MSLGIAAGLVLVSTPLIFSFRFQPLFFLSASMSPLPAILSLTSRNQR